jgi:5-methylcytosine-specific restriction endonuclease McrA
MSEFIPAALRTLVQRRATHCCEYCLVHEEDTELAHEPDHVIARKHRGETEAANLAWTCFSCNRHKGSDLASIDPETNQIVRLFNPRIDDWATHFRLEGATIIPLTPEGRVTEFLLQLNRFDRVEVRELSLRQGRYPRQ